MQMQNLTEGPGVARAAVRQREDADFIYYEIEAQGLDRENVKIRVENDTMSVSGRTKRGSLTASFQQQFPVPPGADASRVQMEQVGDLLVVKFPKTPPGR